MTQNIGPAELIVIMSLCCLPLLAGAALVGLAVWAAAPAEGGLPGLPVLRRDHPRRGAAVVCRFCGRDGLAPSPAAARRSGRNHNPITIPSIAYRPRVPEVAVAMGSHTAAATSRIRPAWWTITPSVGRWGCCAISDADRRNPIAVLLLALALASVVLLIEDLDRPQQGALRVSQQAMEDVQRLIQADAP